MAGVVFNKVLVLGVRFGTSKAGNPWANLQFLDSESLQVYDVMQFGDSVAVVGGLAKGSNVSLGFDVVPDRNGGARLELVQVGQVDMAY